MSASLRIFKVVVQVVAATAVCATASAGEPGLEASARSVGTHLDREGAARVLAELDRKPALFATILEGVETAEPAWLQVARGLRTEADGAAAEQLDMAVARALPHDPSRVLALVGNGMDLARVCTSPFIEPGPGVAEAYEARTLKALDTVRSPDLRPLADACAQRVRLQRPANVPG